ncbi:MAG: hypothetical protein MUP55_00205, partial [Candidatus Aenigmarchaeota archaeon]|nr:hypothetical protein [Candidatus Aenigmarchaeota archaeon]
MIDFLSLINKHSFTNASSGNTSTVEEELRMYDEMMAEERKGKDDADKRRREELLKKMNAK